MKFSDIQDYPLVAKAFSLILIIMLLLWPISAITQLIQIRYQNEQQAVHNIQKNIPLQQQILGPVLLLDYHHADSPSVMRHKVIQPEFVDYTTTLETQPRKLGVYTTHLFKTHTQIEGSFIIPAADLELFKNHEIILKEVQLVVLVSDAQALLTLPPLNLNEQTYTFSTLAHHKIPEGKLTAKRQQGIKVNINQQTITAQPLNFSFLLSLTGNQIFEVVPVGNNSIFNIRGDWPHPGFTEGILPTQHDVSQKGFTAQWQSFWLSEPIAQYLSQIETDGLIGNQEIKLPVFSITMKDPVSQYTLSMRAIKYAILFILVTFSAFLLCEILFLWQVHIVNYVLIGFSLVTFFLLLLALSEHLGFINAYLLAAFACIIQISYYIGTLVKRISAGLWAALGFSFLYLALLGILKTENFALLFGSIFIFTILSMMMIFTRNIDWKVISQSQLPSIMADKNEKI